MELNRLTSLASMVWGTDESSKKPLDSIQQNKVIKLVNLLNSNMVPSIDIPRIVVVGTQSSGKSSLLNGILGMNLMPTGKEMVTRAPLDLRLLDSKERFAKFLPSGETIKLSNPPTAEQVDKLARQIETMTVKRAGKQKGISSQAIELEIHAPNLPPLSMVDLPGLTSVACRDKGQPPDIKQQLRDMVKRWIEPERTIVCCVMAARPDLETDMALELVKSVDCTGERTLGVITKPDLMNRGTDIAHYLRNDVSSDLKLGLGYLSVVNCLDSANEKDFFQNHPKYKKLLDRTCISTVARRTSEYLAEKVMESIPRVSGEIDEQIQSCQHDLLALGGKPPSTDQEKQATLHQVLLDFFNHYAESLDCTESGCRLKEAFIQYRDTMKELAQKDLVEREMVKKLIESYNGNHMECSVSPIAILEKMVLDTGFKHFIIPSMELVNKTIQIMLQQLEGTAEKMQLNIRFPALVEAIKDQVLNSVLERDQAKTSIQELACFESSYLWTEDDGFKKYLFKGNDNVLELTMQLSRRYCQTVSETFQNLVPKIIMYRLVRSCGREGFKKTITREGLIESLQECDKTRDRRSQLTNSLERLMRMKESIRAAIS